MADFLIKQGAAASIVGYVRGRSVFIDKNGDSSVENEDSSTENEAIFLLNSHLVNAKMQK